MNECREEYGDLKNVSVYTEQIFQSSGKRNTGADIYLEGNKVSRYAKEIGVLFHRSANLSLLKTNYCMADNSRGFIRVKLRSEQEITAVRERIEEAEKKTAAEGTDIKEAATAAENACPEDKESYS